MFSVSLIYLKFITLETPYSLLTGHRESEDRQGRQAIPRCKNPKRDCAQGLRFVPVLIYLFRCEFLDSICYPWLLKDCTPAG